MECRNIRALETNSHCRKSNNYEWLNSPFFDSDDYIHHQGVDIAGNNASVCVDEFVKSNPHDVPVGYIPPEHRSPVFRSYRPVGDMRVRLKVNDNEVNVNLFPRLKLDKDRFGIKSKNKKKRNIKKYKKRSTCRK